MKRNLLLTTLPTIINATLRGNRHLTILTPTADATLRSSSPYTNYGYDDTLGFISNPTSLNEEVVSLLQFTFSSWHNYSNKKVYLQLFTGEECDLSSNPLSNSLGLLHVSLAENDMEEGWLWNEESVTWFNGPKGKEGAEIVNSLGGLKGKSWFEVGMFHILLSLCCSFSFTIHIFSP
jgi:hypothetical protein